MAHGKSNNPGGGKPDKLIRDALLGAIRQGPEKLKKGAEKLLERYSEGDLEVAKFIADRIDGKAVQPIVGSDEHDAIKAVLKVECEIVDPKDAGPSLG